MAPWIVHLRLAENLLADFPDLDAAMLSIGSVAPDSGIPDERHEHYDPPGEVTHFRAAGTARFALADLAFYREFLQPALLRRDAAEKLAFLMGYFFHLVTDNLWLEQIDNPTRARLKPQFDADPGFIWQVKRDWYGLDLAYVRANPDCLYWRVFLDLEYREDYLPYLPPDAIGMRIQEIKDLYRRTDDEIESWYGQRPGIYLSQREYDAFVEGNRSLLARLCARLIAPPEDFASRESVLEIEG